MFARALWKKIFSRSHRRLHRNILAEIIKVGLPLNSAGTRVIFWRKSIAEVISETSPEVTKSQRWGSIARSQKTIRLNHVKLVWHHVAIPQLTSVFQIEFSYCEEQLRGDKISGTLTLFCDDAPSLHKELTTALGKPQLQEREIDRGDTAKLLSWDVPGIGEVVQGYANCVFLQVFSG